MPYVIPKGTRCKICRADMSAARDFTPQRHAAAPAMVGELASLNG